MRILAYYDENEFPTNNPLARNKVEEDLRKHLEDHLKELGFKARVEHNPTEPGLQCYVQMETETIRINIDVPKVRFGEDVERKERELFREVDLLLGRIFANRKEEI